jgi:hypothetical protein
MKLPYADQPISRLPEHALGELAEQNGYFDQAYFSALRSFGRRRDLPRWQCRP